MNWTVRVDAKQMLDGFFAQTTASLLSKTRAEHESNMPFIALPKSFAHITFTRRFWKTHHNNNKGHHRFCGINYFQQQVFKRRKKANHYRLPVGHNWHLHAALAVVRTSVAIVQRSAIKDNRTVSLNVWWNNMATRGTS